MNKKFISSLLAGILTFSFGTSALAQPQGLWNRPSNTVLGGAGKGGEGYAYPNDFIKKRYDVVKVKQVISHTFTKQEIKDINNKRDIVNSIASLIPGGGVAFAILKYADGATNPVDFLEFGGVYYKHYLIRHRVYSDAKRGQLTPVQYSHAYCYYKRSNMVDSNLVKIKYIDDGAPVLEKW